MAKSLKLFSSFLKIFLRSAGLITLCNPGVNLCQGISEESLRILCSILKAVPSPAFEPNGAGSFQTLEPPQSLSRSWTQPGNPTAGDMGTFPPLPLNLGRVGSQVVNGLHKFLIAKLSSFLNMFAGSGKKRLSCCSGLSGSL